MFGELLKISYLFIVEIKIGNGASASQRNFSGAPNFTACLARKNSFRKSTMRVNQPQTINLRFFITECQSADKTKFINFRS